MSARRLRHVAIVMDGNGRWAKQRNLPRYEGHQAGASSVRSAIEFAVKQEIEVLTLFALSIENHECRPSAEVQFLLALLLESLQSNTDALHQKQIRVRVIGDRCQFNLALRDQIDQTEQLTKGNKGLVLVLAINYSGRWDIVQAAQRLAADIASDQFLVEDVDQNRLASYLCLSDLPEPDLLIRTGGELRISNFMLWQFAYTELIFLQEYWPDFNATVFQRALDDYAQRQRRFGLTGEQVESTNA